MNNFQVDCWGSIGWTYLHFIAHSYPDKNPSIETRRDYETFFEYVGKTLPCSLCRKSYHLFLKEESLNYDSKQTLTRSLFDLHNKVNKKIGKPINNDFESVYKYYESCRSTCPVTATGCTVPAIKARKMIANISIVPVDDSRMYVLLVMILLGSYIYTRFFR